MTASQIYFNIKRITKQSLQFSVQITSQPLQLHTAAPQLYWMESMTVNEIPGRLLHLWDERACATKTQRRYDTIAGRQKEKNPGDRLVNTWLINVIRIQLHNILWQLLNTSVPRCLSGSLPSPPLRRRGRAEEAEAERHADTKTNCPICIQWCTIRYPDKNGCTEERRDRWARREAPINGQQWFYSVFLFTGGWPPL